MPGVKSIARAGNGRWVDQKPDVMPAPDADGTQDKRAGMVRDTRRKETTAMPKHTTGTREEWLAARLPLLEAEKELTRRGDELAQQRQALPWVRIDKDYRFET